MSAEADISVENQKTSSKAVPKDDAAEEGPKPMSLIDVNDDCLEEIFKYLRLEELVNIADTHPRFKGVAATVYSRTYRDLFILIGHEKRRDEYHLRFLRHFGHLVQELTITANLEKFDFRLLGAISEHCGPTTKSLSLRFWGKSTSRVRGKKYCRLFLEQLSTNFPKLNRLRFSADELQYFRRLKHLVQKFPSLTYLIVNVYEHSVENFKAIVQLNPQLEVIEIDFKDVTLTQDLVKSIDSALPRLQILCVTSKAVQQIDRFEPKYFKNLAVLQVHGTNITDLLNLLAVSNNKLEEFIDNCETTDQINYPIEIVCHYKQLNVLWLTHSCLTDDSLISFADNLPLIGMLISCNSKVSAAAVVHSVQRWTKLKTFRAHYFDLFMVDRHYLDFVKSELDDNEWKITSEIDELYLDRIVR